MNKILLLGFILISGWGSFFVTAQRKSKEKAQQLQVEQTVVPKLIVGVIVDQMRFDYLTRFANHYGEGGFQRLIRKGFNCRNNHFNYSETSTAPGHASVYTGSTPSVHGIVGNNWYDKVSKQMVYCVADPEYSSLGTTSDAGQMSPHRLNAPTITDKLRTHFQLRSKVISISIKDRGAVLPAGFTANAAYWFRGYSEGKWISSSFYMDELPQWVSDFNASGIAASYKKTWNTLKEINQYLESGPDSNKYEEAFAGENGPVFPHRLDEIWDANNRFELIKSSPYGNSLTTDFAIAAIDNENLGKDQYTDFLAISYSSTDIVGHQFGVNSKEIQDMYLRLDLELERLMETLDNEVGEGEYTLFLTADHGAMNVSSYLEDLKIPAGLLGIDKYNDRFEEFLRYKYGTTDIIQHRSNKYLFFNYDVIANLGLERQKVEEDIRREILTYDPIDRVYTADQLLNSSYVDGISNLVQNTYNPKRSGDLLLIYKAANTAYGATGSDHGSPYKYDTHVPLIFYGAGINNGSTVNRTNITDIAPTIATLLGIAFPDGSQGEPIKAVLK
ncbi:MAG: alkaline phosphatase PafA [Flavobacteriaceae bacterium]